MLTKKKPPKRHHGKKAKKAKKHAQKQAPAQTGRPNIVVVMMDDMRADELQYAPNVNSLITARGLTFANSFAVSVVLPSACFLPHRAIRPQSRRTRHRSALGLWLI